MPERRPNLLINEKSPYLQEHAFNPVEWRPWGEAALKKAKNDGKPIFLSIGYSTCHWCHRFATESFDDEATAAIINKNFVPIKVDREERPEVDAYYMKAVQAMTGGGGWPLTVFLTPDLKPFYGGTYFPPHPRDGMPSFKQVLEFVAKVWKDRKGEIVASSEQVASSISGELQKHKEIELGKEILDEGYASLLSSFDREHGGFGGPPKFPLPLVSSFLLRYHYRTGKELALTSVTKTLDMIMSGGIRDHVGGGFHRYAVDRIWLVPHFEKMLYDNALLAKLFTEGYQVTKNEGYAGLVREALDWIMKEMTDAGGGFFSAEDADTKDGEGVYYTWTPKEVEEAMGIPDAGEFCKLYHVTNVGNFEGRSILHLDPSLRGSTESYPPVAKWKSKLYSQRVKRNRPAVDTKILTSWNGLAISAFAYAGRVLEEEKYLDAAVRAAEFVLMNNGRDGRLLRRYAGGEAALEGTLEDYAFLVAGLLDLYEASSEVRWLEEALRLTEVMVSELEDKEQGGFYLTARSEVTRLKEGYDGVTPSGNSTAAVNLIRLAELTGREDLRTAAERVLKFFSADIEQQPSGQAYMLIALDMLRNGLVEVVITSNKPSTAESMVRETFKEFVPNKVVLVGTADNYAELSKLTSLLEGREPTAKARGYVCVNFTCKLPANDVATLKVQLQQARLAFKRRPGRG